MSDPSTAVYHPTVGMPGLPFSEPVQEVATAAEGGRW